MSTSQVDIWRVSLVSADRDAAPYLTLLSAAERERAGRFMLEQDRARFISARASLRVLLGRQAGIAPGQIIFRYEPRGKPALAGVDGLHFNLSHSRELAVVAISRDNPVGIDLERIDPGFPCMEVAREVMAPDELADLRALPLEALPARFFSLWTMKEALLKAVGAGLGIEPREIRIRNDEETGEAAIISAPGDLAGAMLHRLEIDPCYAAALAVMGKVSAIAIHKFNP